MKFSTKRFLNDQFGSPDGVIALIAKHGQNAPNRAAVEKWFYRDNVPGDWWPVLILVLHAEGKVEADFSSYLEGEKDDVFA